MAVNFERFLNWCEQRFDLVKIKGDEIQVNSPFYEELHGEKDYKCKLWCNPTGGKREVENGVFHCWRTGRHGSLITLIKLIDKCSYEDALAILGLEDTSMAEIELKLEKLFQNQESIQKPKDDGFQLPPYTFLITDLSPSNFYRVIAEVHLFKRSLPIDGLMICCAGNYKDRIIIPYYNQKNELIYYNARYIGNRCMEGRKYMGPPEGTTILKGDVIYMTKWPEPKSEVFYTEGEFDAISIEKAGLHAGALGGKNLSEIQIELIRPYVPIICLDHDDAGLNALPSIGDQLLSRGISFIRYVFPPQQCKDWNKMLEQYGPRILKAYLQNNKKLYTNDYSLTYKMEKI